MNPMRELKPISEEEYQNIVKRVYGRKLDKLTMNQLTAVIIRLDGQLREEKKRRIIVEHGVAAIIDDYNFTINKVFFRNHQLRQAFRMVTNVLHKAIKLAKMLPPDWKCRRGMFLRYLKKIQGYKTRLYSYVPKDKP